MAYTLKTLENSQVELVITVTPDEYESHLQHAATHLSEKGKIKGFRPGKAPFDVVKREFGEMAILQEALDNIIRDTYYQAVITEKLETLGMPQVTVEKVAPGNDVVYKAVVALLPKVTLPDIKKISVTRTVKEVGDKEITETIDALRGMHATEIIKSGPAEGTDKLVLDLDMFIDKVPVDGGQAKNYQVYLSEDHYIPGFNDQVKGLKKDDTKSFTLTFPKEHYQKQLAGKSVDFTVSVKEVYERALPELTDDFAKKLGLDTTEKLKDLIRDNLLREAHQKATQTAEIAILEQLIEKTTIDAIPSVLIDSERQKMFHELKRDLEKNGITIEKYLEDIKKDEKTLFEEFKTQAEKRAKAALISRQIAIDNNITVDESDISNEIEMIRGMYEKQPEYLENLKRPEVRDSIATTLQNKKVMAWLRAKVLGEEVMEDKNLHAFACGHDHNHAAGEPCDHDHAHDHNH